MSLQEDHPKRTGGPFWQVHGGGRPHTTRINATVLLPELRSRIRKLVAASHLGMGARLAKLGQNQEHKYVWKDNRGCNRSGVKRNSGRQRTRCGVRVWDSKVWTGGT